MSKILRHLLFSVWLLLSPVKFIHSVFGLRGVSAIIVDLRGGRKGGGAWVAQLVGWQTAAQVMILRFVGLSLMLGSVLTADTASLCPAPAFLLLLPKPHTLSLKNK